MSILPAVSNQLTDPSADLELVIRNTVTQFQQMFQFTDEIKELLIADLRTNFNTTVSLPGILRGKNGYEEWLEEKKQQNKIEWKQWSRYKYYLRTVKGWSENVINSLDETSDKILDLLADPTLKGRSFDRRGLVVGYVQSGKTASFTSVINKAFDAGFKVVIVLAGMHNNLRSQTQVRLDEEVVGFTMQQKNMKDRFVGVGTLKGYQFTDVSSLTNRDDDGDFDARKAGTMFKPPILLVVKKNKTVLTNLLNYLQRKSQFAQWATDGSKKKVVHDLPLLIIDDEADQATVNTSEIYDDDDQLIEDYNPSAINGLIREIFHTFEQRAYIGYTATPFANILIDRSSQTDQHGMDMFPRDFIISLPKPDNYTGPAEYFNIYDDPDNQQTGLIRYIEQDDLFMPAGHKKDHIPHALPDDLVESIYAYLIATATRRLRGHVKAHSSMLVHVTRFTDVQHLVFELVYKKVQEIRDAIRYAGKGHDHFSRIRKLYEDDFVKTSDSRGQGTNTFDWDKVHNEIINVVEKVHVKEINGKSGDALEYSEHKEGYYVIAIGGDKLSRGLTLDGLVVSYYMRTSKMYDTLMQMGRWFGYRDGYLDLCRIYTTEELANWFYEIAVATEELRGQLLEMAEQGATPEQYVLQISVHPDMLITSSNKMRSAQTVRVSYSGSMVQTTVFENRKEFFRNNFDAVTQFVQRLGQAQIGDGQHVEGIEPIVKEKEGYLYWENVSADDIIFFLEKYKTSASLSRVDTFRLKEYVDKRNEVGELTSWTVVIVNTGTNQGVALGDLKLKSGVRRKGDEVNYHATAETISIRILTTEGHEFLDYTKDVYEQVQVLLENNKKKVNGQKGNAGTYYEARSKRSDKKGLLLLYPLDMRNGVLKQVCKNLDLSVTETPFGFAISFPRSENAIGEKDYVINKSV